MPLVPALVRWMIVLPLRSACDASSGELPKSNPAGARPSTSPMTSWPAPLSRSARASSTPLTMMIRDAPLASATAAVEKARNTSMIPTTPVACSAPPSRLSMRTSMRVAVLVADSGHCASIAGAEPDQASTFARHARETMARLPRSRRTTSARAREPVRVNHVFTFSEQYRDVPTPRAGSVVPNPLHQEIRQ